MFDGIESASAAPFPSMAKKTTKGGPPIGSSDAERAARLIRLREAYGFETSASFAGHLHLSPQRWNGYENGGALSVEVAMLLVRTFSGITLDWLFLGKTDGLSIQMASRLGLLPAPGNRSTA